MRIALFSDIHGNLTGLRAVLAAIPALGGADVLVAAGDLIGGESGTDEVLELLQEHAAVMIRGDSDTEQKLIDLEQAAERAPGTTRSSPGYYRALRAWLRAHLSEAGCALLAGLPASLTLEAAPGRRLFVCHASPRSTADRVCAPQCGAETLRAIYADVDADVIAFGHAHVPHVRWLDARLFVNVASVGLRQDGLSRLTLLECRGAEWLVQQHAIAYDVAAEARRARERGVPPLEP